MSRDLLPVSDATVRKATEIAEASAMARWLGTTVSLNKDRHLYRLTFAEPHIGNPVIRALHGGVISSFLESAATLEIKSRTDDAIRVRSISVHTSYLRGSRAADLDVAVEVQRIGRRIAFLEAAGWQGDGGNVARAQIALRLFEEGG